MRGHEGKAKTQTLVSFAPFCLISCFRILGGLCGLLFKKWILHCLAVCFAAYSDHDVAICRIFLLFLWRRIPLVGNAANPLHNTQLAACKNWTSGDDPLAALAAPALNKIVPAPVVFRLWFCDLTFRIDVFLEFVA